MAGLAWCWDDLEFAWSHFRRHTLWWLSTFLVAGVFFKLSGGLLAGPLLLGFFYALEKSDEGGEPSFDDLFKGFTVFSKVFVATLPMALVLLVAGFFTASLLVTGWHHEGWARWIAWLFIIPIDALALIVTLPVTGATVYAVLRGEVDGMAVCRRAFDACTEKQRLAPVLIMAFILLLLLEAGRFFLGIGLLVTGPLVIAALYRLGQRVYGRLPLPAINTPAPPPPAASSSASPEAPSTGKAHGEPSAAETPSSEAAPSGDAHEAATPPNDELPEF